MENRDYWLNELPGLAEAVTRTRDGETQGLDPALRISVALHIASITHVVRKNRGLVVIEIPDDEAGSVARMLERDLNIGGTDAPP